MDILIEILSLISDNSSLAIPVVSIAAIWVTAFIFFHNKKDALVQRITHKRNVWLSFVIAFAFLFLVLVAIDKEHFHITIWWWITVVLWVISIMTVYHDMNPMFLVTGNNNEIFHHRRLRYYATELSKGNTDCCERVLNGSEIKLKLEQGAESGINYPVILPI